MIVEEQVPRERQRPSRQRFSVLTSRLSLSLLWRNFLMSDPYSVRVVRSFVLILCAWLLQCSWPQSLSCKRPLTIMNRSYAMLRHWQPLINSLDICWRSSRFMTYVYICNFPLLPSLTSVRGSQCSSAARMETDCRPRWHNCKPSIVTILIFVW